MADETSDTPTRTSRGWATLVKAVAFVSVIVLLEIAAASMLLPDAEETIELGRRLAATQNGVEGDGLAVEGSATSALGLEDSREVRLGEYHVLTYDPNTGSSLAIDFELYGIVLAEEESTFYEQYEGNQQRISEQVNITIRAMEPADFADPGLGLIRRKILAKVNRALGEPVLQEVVFPKFSYIER